MHSFSKCYLQPLEKETLFELALTRAAARLLRVPLAAEIARRLSRDWVRRKLTIYADCSIHGFHENCRRGTLEILNGTPGETLN